MWKYNLYMNEICNVHYLIAKFKFNPFKYSYVIFYDLSWLCAHLCIHRALFLYIWVLPFFFLFWTRPKIKLMKNYMAKNKRKMEMIHFFHCYHLSYNSLANSIFTIPNMEQQQQCKTKKRSAIFIRNHITIYEVLRKDISFCSFIIYSQLYIYPFPLGPSQCPSASICYAMSWQCCWLYILLFDAFFSCVRFCCYFHWVFRMLVFLYPALLSRWCTQIIFQHSLCA